MSTILFITANRIGDAVLSMGVLAHLIETYPDARFTIACGPATQDLFRAVPRLERLHVLRKRPYHGHWIDLWKACHKTKWDLIVDLRNSFVSRLLSAKRKAYRPAHITGHHRVENNARALALTPPPAPRIWFDAQTIKTADALLGAERRPLLALGPAANWTAKQWPLFNFKKLAQRIIDADGFMPDAVFLIIAASSERAQIQDLIDALPQNRVIVSTSLDLLEAAACLKRARLFIGNDSGLMHIAAACGVPTLGLFGPSQEQVYGPWGTTSHAIRTTETFAEIVARMPYPGADYPNQMTGLNVERVYDAAKALYTTASANGGHNR